MKGYTVYALALALAGCSATSRTDAEYFKDFQTQMVSLSQRIEVLESRAKKETTMKGDVYEKVDSLEKRVEYLDTAYSKVKAHPLFEGMDTVRLTPAPSTNVITIRPESVGSRSEGFASTRKEEIPLREESTRKELPQVESAEPQHKRQATAPGEKPAVVYNRGYEMYSAGKYAQAISILRDFIQNYPASDLADNAQYWIGECYYSQKLFDRAIAEFKKVETLPDGNKIPDAYLKMMYSYFEIGKKDEARSTGRTLIDKYGNTDAAKKAKEKMSQ